MLKKISRRLLSIGFRQRIAFLLIMFTLVPSAVIQQAVQYIYEDQIIRNASEAVYSVVAANDNTISTILEQVEDTSQLMLNDESYYNTFADIVDGTVSDFMKCDREITLKLAREFTTQNYVFETYLYTQDWLYGGKRDNVGFSGRAFRLRTDTDGGGKERKGMLDCRI